MKFGVIITATLLTVLTTVTSFCQHQMTKDEIFKTWQGFQHKHDKDSLFRFEVQEQTRHTLDKLLSSGVDTILVYSVSYPGSVEVDPDSCSTLYPVDSYFFWRQKGVDYYRKVNGNCVTGQSMTNDKLNRFILSNFEKMSKEFFMGVIYGVSVAGDDLHISGYVVDHETNYEILIQLGGGFKYLRFTDSELTDKKSLFYRYNQNLTSYKLFRLIKSELKKI